MMPTLPFKWGPIVTSSASCYKAKYIRPSLHLDMNDFVPSVPFLFESYMTEQDIFG